MYILSMLVCIHALKRYLTKYLFQVVNFDKLKFYNISDTRLQTGLLYYVVVVHGFTCINTIKPISLPQKPKNEDILVPL